MNDQKLSSPPPTRVPRLCTDGGKFKDHLFAYKWSGRYRKCTRKGCERTEWADLASQGRYHPGHPCGLAYFELSPRAIAFNNAERWNRGTGAGNVFDEEFRKYLQEKGGSHSRVASEIFGAGKDGMAGNWKDLEQNFFMKAKERLKQ